VFFSLTDEQRALQATVRDFIADRFPLSAVREVYDDEDGNGDPDELWKAVGAQGWLAVMVPEDYDGLGLGLLDAAVLARCWGEGCVPGSFLPTLVAAEGIRLGGSEAQRKEWLPQVAAGSVKLTPAFGGRVTAADGKLSGTVDHVEYAHVADRLVVAADGGTLWLVDPSDPGVTVTVHDGLDRSTRLARVRLDSAVGEPLDKPVLPVVSDRAAVLYANDLAGIARVALDRTVDYDKTREQFGRPVGSFQAIQHKFADLATQLAQVRLLVRWVARLTDEDPGRMLPQEASMVKLAATELAKRCALEGVQIMGGYGYASEYPMERYLRGAVVTTIYGGTSEIQKNIIAKTLGL
jgi:acyl-CoA dehydrogenase